MQSGDNPYTRLQQAEHMYNQLKMAYDKCKREFADSQIELNTLRYVSPFSPLLGF